MEFSRGNLRTSSVCRLFGSPLGFAIPGYSFLGIPHCFPLLGFTLIVHSRGTTFSPVGGFLFLSFLGELHDLPEFRPESAHPLLQGVYGDFPHHNDRAHLDEGIMDDAAWQRCWRRLDAQSASWYATPSGAVGRRFTPIFAAEWWGVLNRSWNSEIPIVFAHVVLTKTLGVCRAQDIRDRITWRMDV